MSKTKEEERIEKVKEDKFLKPNGKGLIVRDPISFTPLSEDGEYKPWYGSGAARYWRRRVKDGSVIISSKNPPAKDKPVLRERKYNKTEDNE